MKYTIFLLLFVQINLNAQSNYLKRLHINDELIINTILNDSINKKEEYLIYIPAFKQNYTSILLNAADNKYWCINNDSIIRRGFLVSDFIFQYKDYKKTGATELERLDKNTFRPPIIGSGYNTETVIYKNCNIEFYFEYGDNITTHKKNKNKSKYRKKWLEIIRKDFKDILIKNEE